DRVVVEGRWSGTAASWQSRHAGPGGKRHCRCHGPCRAQLRNCQENAEGEADSLPRCRSCLSISVPGGLLRRSAEVYRKLEGRRSTILIGLSSSLLGTALFAIAPSVLWVFVGRAFIALGVGLCAGPAAAALLEFSAAGQESRASSINTLAQAVGIVLATIVGGALIQYAPYPTHLNFWVLLVV